MSLEQAHGERLTTRVALEGFLQTIWIRSDKLKRERPTPRGRSGVHPCRREKLSGGFSLWVATWRTEVYSFD